MGKKLLLADDSITIQKVVELVLAGEGFDIKAANNGDEALSVLPSFEPDVVLADIAMPVMNGYQFCERIKKNPETKGIPVILLAGAFEPIDEELAKNVGADDYIVKPFESQELISKINAVLLSKEMTEEAPVEAGVSRDADTVLMEEDLWTMEEIAAESVEEGVMAETLLKEEVGLEEEFGIETAAIEEAFVEEGVPEPRVERAAPAAPIAPVAAAQVELPSREEFAAIFRKAVDEKVASLVSAVDVKDLFIESLGPSIKDTVEKVLWETVPQLSERLLREILQGVLASLTKEIEKVLWEAVPDLAETMISREIEKIRSEM